MYLTVTLVNLYFFLSPSLTVTVSMYVWLSKIHLKTGAINGGGEQYSVLVKFQQMCMCIMHAYM